MFNYDDEEFQAYFSFYENDEDDDVSITNKECGHEASISKKENLGIYCRACNEYNAYVEPDCIILDGEFTCWRCARHPERKKTGLPSDKVKDLDDFYKKN